MCIGGASSLPVGQDDILERSSLGAVSDCTQHYAQTAVQRLEVGFGKNGCHWILTQRLSHHLCVRDRCGHGRLEAKACSLTAECVVTIVKSEQSRERGQSNDTALG